MKIKINKKIQEMSSMGGGAVQGHVDNRKEELKEEEFPEKVHKKARYLQDEEGKPRDQAYAIAISMHEDGKLEEMYSSAGIMGMGSGRIPAERSPEGHERYVRMRHNRQGLKNFKPNRYFAEDKNKKRKIKIKIRKNLEEKCQKGYKTHEKRKTKKMFGKTYRNCVKAEGKDPKTGTGKKPEGSKRRLYTDEDPSDTVSVKFSTVQDIKDTFSKASFKSKSHKRQSQIINLVHQRVRAAYQNAKDPKVKKRLKKAFDYAKKRKEASKKKTQSMQKSKKSLKENINKEDLQKIMLKHNIDVGEELGRGQYGQVFAGISDDYGPVAIKAIKISGGSMREVPNYVAINAARSKSPYIAKHFPEVYFVDEKSSREFKYVVMEILGVEQGYQQELINTLFGGLNTALKPFEDEKEVSGKFRDRSNRMYVLFKNKESQESIIQSVYNDFGPDLDFLLPVIKMFLSNIDGYVSNVKSTSKAEQDISFMMLSGKAEEYLYNFANGEFKEEFKTAPWLLTFITEQLVALQKEDSSGSLFARHHQGLILYWLEYIRKSSIIGLRDAEFGTRSLDDSGVEKDQWSAFKEAASIKKAIKDLRDLAGLDPRDMHDQNVMVRPQTGDIVIVDVGLFRKI